MKTELLEIIPGTQPEKVNVSIRFDGPDLGIGLIKHAVVTVDVSRSKTIDEIEKVAIEEAKLFLLNIINPEESDRL